jgi:hypothetical protein
MLLQAIGEKLGKIESADIDVGRHLFEVKENFTKFGALSSLIEMISAGSGRQTLLMETLIEETRNTQKRLAAINQTLLISNKPAG